MIIGIIVSLDAEGYPLVDYPGNQLSRAVHARAACPFGIQDIGGEAVLLFEDGEAERPIIVGCISKQIATAGPVAIGVDEKIFEFQAAKQLTIRCGEASITLTRAGKILIRGKYILSDSTGVNMVKGGLIRLNG